MLPERQVALLLAEGRNVIGDNANLVRRSLNRQEVRCLLVEVPCGFQSLGAREDFCVPIILAVNEMVL
jgi:hypothetical protein